MRAKENFASKGNQLKRRLLLTFTAWMSLGGAACAGLTQVGGRPRHTVPADQLQQAVAQRFPLRYPVAGLLDLEVKTPRLRLLPEQNRLATEVVVEAAGPALRRSYTGAFDMAFALRYEASDRTIRAHQLEVRQLRLPGLPARTLELLDTYLPALARQALGDVVLHTLRPKDLALADAMGLQPDTLTVTPDGLEIGFAPSAPAGPRR